jgi:hypothetical protein
MKAMSMALGSGAPPRPGTKHICKFLLTFSTFNAADAPDRVDPKSGARARARAAEWRGRLAGQRKEPA